MALSRRGFTLIELLVVIGIIGVLSSIILVSLNQAKSKAQHAQTIAEVKQIESALVQVADDNGGHPVSTSGHLACLGTTSCWGGTVSNNATLDAAIAKYLHVPAVNLSKPSSVNGYFLYRSPATYFDNTNNVTVNGTSNSYSLVWVPSYINPPSQQPTPADCSAENATWGTWDNDSAGPGGTPHCAIVNGQNTGSCRQCGVIIEQ